MTGRRTTWALPLAFGALLSLVAAPTPARAGIPSCPDAPQSAATLAPASADFFASAAPAAFDANATGRGLQRLLQLDLRGGQWLATYRRCLSAAESITVAGSGAGAWAWTFRGPGVGDAATLDCLADQAARRARGERPYDTTPLEAAGGCARVYAHGDGAQSIALGEDFLVIASSEWATRVREALAQPARRGAARDLLEAAALAGSGDLALAGTLHRPDTLLDPGPWMQSLRNFAAALDVTASGRLETTLILQTRDFGESVLSALQLAVPEWHRRLVAMGLPHDVLDALELETRAERVRLRWSADPSALQRIGQALANEQRGGGLF